MKNSERDEQTMNMQLENLTSCQLKCAYFLQTASDATAHLTKILELETVLHFSICLC